MQSGENLLDGSIGKEILISLQVKPGQSIRLAELTPSWDVAVRGGEIKEQQLADRLEELLERKRGLLQIAQEKLYASDRYSVLVIFQGMAGADIDSAIRHVMTGVNPQGCQSFEFSKITSLDLRHDFLWPFSQALPDRGRIGIFDHSYYDDVIYPKIKPENLDRLKIEIRDDPDDFWERRYRDICDFERHLVSNNTAVLKLFLHISKEEQRQRFLDRIYDPKQRWRFSLADLEERQHWDQYLEAYEQALNATSTAQSPWYVLPADQPWVASLLAAELLTGTILGLGVDYPKVSEATLSEFRVAREQLENEG